MHQSNQISKVLNAKLCLPNHIPVRNADWFKCHFRQLYFEADWSKKSLPFYAVTSFQRFCFHFGRKHVAFTWLTCAKMRSAVRSDNNIVVERESIKAVEKDLCATVVTSIHSTGATVVNSVKCD